uniref:Uncharacterized protein n=1 Tax=Fagus sylvatica TaxID=28930 RepID=A0A2N9EDJ5_FAGSY
MNHALGTRQQCRIKLAHQRPVAGSMLDAFHYAVFFLYLKLSSPARIIYLAFNLVVHFLPYPLDFVLPSALQVSLPDGLSHCGWNIRCMDSGNMHHFVGADASCISWGHAQHGELGFGPNGQKSSAVPKKVDILEGMHVISVACGMGHSMVIVDRTNAGDRLDQLDTYDGKDSGEGSEEPEIKTVAKQTTKKGSAKAANNSNKRKKSKHSSDSEDEESDDDSENGEEQVNGETEKESKGGKGSNGGRGKGAAKPVRGRGRPPSANKSSQPSQGKTGKRGRPRKS